MDAELEELSGEMSPHAGQTIDNISNFCSTQDPSKSCGEREKPLKIERPVNKSPHFGIYKYRPAPLGGNGHRLPLEELP